VQVTSKCGLRKKILLAVALALLIATMAASWLVFQLFFDLSAYRSTLPSLLLPSSTFVEHRYRQDCSLQIVENQHTYYCYNYTDLLSSFGSSVHYH